MLFIGIISGILTGIAQPLQIVAFGDVVNAFNPAEPMDDATFAKNLNQVVFYFVRATGAPTPAAVAATSASWVCTTQPF